MRMYTFVVIVLILALAFTSVFLFAPMLLPSHLQQPADRISLAQLVIGVASLLALLLAAWEFRQGQLKPRLRLWIQPWARDEPRGTPTHTYSDSTEYTSTSGVGTVYSFLFKLMLENYGDKSAHWVKVSVELRDPRDPVARLVIHESELQRLSREQPSGKWIPDVRASKSKRHSFHGGSDFVVYSHPKKVEELYPWLEDIGLFELKIPVTEVEKEDNRRPTVEIIYSVQADGFVSHNQKLQFRLI